jgi:dihydropteroate synthase
MSDDQPQHEAARREAGQAQPGQVPADREQPGQSSLPGLPTPGRCLVIGVLNVTPDSFSDGGAWFDRDTAIRRGLELAGQGADLVDVGGESTRPGAQRVPAGEELGRVLPVIGALAAAGVRVSVDTMRAQVAEAALSAGACLVNDVSGGLADPQMPRLVAQAGVAYVVMHWRGHSHDMMQRAVYRDVVGEVRAELRRRVDAIVAEGVDPSRIILDPGLGFAKNEDHNWALLTRLSEIAALGGGSRFPVLIGASRKSFLGRLLAAPDGTPRSFAGRDAATVAVTALAAMAGAWAVRVHEVPGNVDAARVAMAWRSASPAAAGSTGPEPPRPARESVRPARESVRPGPESARLGPESARPGAESVRPGAESVWPGAESVRPTAESPCSEPESAWLAPEAAGPGEHG